jgi:hypothetical protein
MSVSNPSQRETTVKDMVSMMPSDMWSIDRMTYYCKYQSASIVQESFLLEKFRDYFSQYLETITLDPKYYFSPSMFAEDYYGDAGLDFMVLYFANMSTLMEFCKPKIKVLSYSHIKEINQMVVRYKGAIDDSYSNPPDYTILGNSSKDTLTIFK